MSNLLNAGMSGALAGAVKPNSSSGFDFMGFLKGSNGGTPNWLSALGTAGMIYGAVNQQQMAKKMFKQQQQAFDFNKMLSQRQISRENQANQNLINAWNASNFNKSREEEL